MFLSPIIASLPFNSDHRPPSNAFAPEWFQKQPGPAAFPFKESELNRRLTGAAKRLEHDAEKCERFSDDIMLCFFDLDPDSSGSRQRRRTSPGRPADGSP
ncbi:hypothetical protein GR223_27895 [Rhizobium leguminosarum]|nr:hypothetical protein [Rhizobium ruizarguesonis]